VSPQAKVPSTGPTRRRGNGLGLFVLALIACLALDANVAWAAPPTATIDPVGTVGYTTAQVSGTVDPADQETFYSFEYSADPASEGWSSFTSQGPIAAGAGMQNVASELTGLKPGTGYQVRLAALNFEESVEYFSAEPNPTLTTKPVANPSVTIEAPTAVTGRTAHFQGEIDPGGTDPAFDVSWHFECQPECPGLQGGEIPADNLSHQVEADAGGLIPGTAYEVTLVAENAGGRLITGPEDFSTEIIAPAIDSTFAGSVSSGAATLKAEIVPDGADTTYYFEYGTDTNYGAKAPAAPVDIGSGSEAKSAGAQLTGLRPGTAYHYRVVATNSVNTTFGPDRTFVTFPSGVPPAGSGCPNEALRAGNSASLPDCRAYEQVTPVDKSGQDGVFYDGTILSPQAAADGNRAAYFSFGAFSGSPVANPTYLATRGATDWSAAAMIPPQSTVGAPITLCAPQYAAYSPDLSSGVLEDGYNPLGGCGSDEPPLVPGEPRGVQNLFLRDNATGTYQLINLTPSGVNPADANFEGGSPDLRHIVFSEPAPLTPEATAGDMLYEWAGGGVSLVGLIPEAPATSCSGSACVAAAGARLGGTNFSEVALVDHAVSGDGSRVIFTANGNLYLRDGGATTQVDLSHGAGASGGGDFMTATGDGGSLLFTDPNQLTGDASPSGEDLYRYEVGSGQLTDLTPDGTDAGGTAVQGLVGASADNSYVYFVADGVLTSSANSKGETATPGDCIKSFGTESERCNLYLRHGGTTTFIATLGGADREAWNGASRGRVTPDGTELAFSSVESLTGYDNSDLRSGKPDAEVYLYDAATDELACASCNPSGARPIGSSTIDGSKFRLRNAEPGGGAFSNNFSLQRNLSENGSRLFFDSSDALVPADTNGRQDVYEYEAPGSGTCTSVARDYAAAAGGCVDLISSGRGEDDSYFYDAGSGGEDAFFFTRARLVGQDTDGLKDLYDARVGGGLASQSPPPPPVPCAGESCRGPSTEPGVTTAGSGSFLGAGNVHPACSSGHRKHKLRQRAERLRRRARKADDGKRARHLDRQAARLIKATRAVGRNCKHAHRGSSK
jgi:Tol biopolymer transport system component